MHVNVTIVGLDRITASIGLAFKRYQGQPRAEHTFTIIGSDVQASPMKVSEKIGAVDNFNRSLSKALDNADVVIFNAPPGQIDESYARLGAELKPGAVVLDLALLKQPAIARANRYFPANDKGAPLAYLVGITPIVNVTGLYSGDLEADAARADLFDNAEVLITPDTQSPSEAISLAEDVVRLMGGRPRFMDPAEHDGLIAATEALPALLGVGMFHMLQQSEGWPELRRMVNPALALIIQNFRYQTGQDLFALFTGNRENLVRHLEALIGTLDQLRDLLADSENADRLEILLGRVQGEWEKWDVKRHSGQWEEIKEPDKMGPLGLMGGFFSLGALGGRRKPDREDEK